MKDKRQLLLFLTTAPRNGMRGEYKYLMAARGSTYLMGFDRHGAPVLVCLLSEHGDVNFRGRLVMVYPALSELLGLQT